jgi:hypothetical protein
MQDMSQDRMLQEYSATDRESILTVRPEQHLPEGEMLSGQGTDGQKAKETAAAYGQGPTYPPQVSPVQFSVSVVWQQSVASACLVLQLHAAHRKQSVPIACKAIGLTSWFCTPVDC